MHPVTAAARDEIASRGYDWPEAATPAARGGMEIAGSNDCVHGGAVASAASVQKQR